MIALFAISVASSAVTMRSHWFALSSTVMSSGLAIGSPLRPRWNSDSDARDLRRVGLRTPPARRHALLGGRHAPRSGLGNERAFARVRRRLLGLREDAGLLEQRQHVGGCPALDDLAVGDAHEVAVRPDELG